ncbi:MAG: type II 3-dehydroquinate dehydratase [Clostridiales bacterium]|nr:type II 3-dehydroquinate dehydratase [Clostridiales bacterium]
MKILTINGPNLNLLGMREPDVYGNSTLESINNEISAYAVMNNVSVDFFQSNHEGDIIDKLHSAVDKYDGIVLNAGAFTHYSYAIHDAIRAIKIPVVEVHLSNVFAREDFRSKSVIAPACVGSVSGFGKKSYILALIALTNNI